MPIIRSSTVLYRWLPPVVSGALVFKFSVWCGDEGYVSGLRAAGSLKTKAPDTTGSNQPYNTLDHSDMGIVVPETCWASNKICNKNHLLHLVGILFPHINDDARSKSLQINLLLLPLPLLLLPPPPPLLLRLILLRLHYNPMRNFASLMDLSHSTLSLTSLSKFQFCIY